jgi:hypothetical protein
MYNDSKGTIYFNQRGAGCGKTYESIQIIQTNEQFKNKDTFIYLTKMHSAKEVIYNEFNDQMINGKLNKFDLEECCRGKQIKISYTNKQTNKKITIYIGTIDSFNYAIVNHNKINKKIDYFKSIVDTIKNGFIKDNIKYAGEKSPIDNECLIIIDEAQDLGKEYIEAFDRIIKETKTDVYVIGDKLQSVFGEHNIYTHIDKNNLDTHIKRSSGINKVMRFHNKKFIKFVNDIIPFKNYGLSPITGICDIPCKYDHEKDEHEKNDPYTIFQVPKIYSNDHDHEKNDDLVDKIIVYMEKEIDKNKYLPNNFMFIFPILSHNSFAFLLAERLQDFWINKFKDSKYQKMLIEEKKTYWIDKINDKNYDKNYYQYVYLHKSDEGKSINLKESENSTRILSIHASKGNGCEVVFVLGITESALTIISKEKCNLVYDSLLHVAITRQKKSIYIGIENNYDDIWNRFNFAFPEKIIMDEKIEPNLHCINSYHKYRRIQDYVTDNDDIYAEIDNNIIKPNKHKYTLQSIDQATYELDEWLESDSSDELTEVTEIEDKSKRKFNIDWGHHVIRYSVMEYYIMSNIIENDFIRHKDGQFITVLKKLSTKAIKSYSILDYNKMIREIDYNNKKSIKNKIQYPNDIIPLLLYSSSENTIYAQYTESLKKIIKHIQEKIIEYYKKQKLPPLCPLECIILQFMRKIMDDGYYSEIPIYDIYNIMYYYDSCSDSINKEHTENNKCICSDCFHGKSINKNSSQKDEADKIRDSIVKHYNDVERIKEIYCKYKKYITETLHIDNIKYNIDKRIYFNDKFTNIKIFNEYKIIGYSDTCVVNIIIKPQFNKLNFNKTICDQILNNFNILNCESKTIINNYNNKKIHTCVLTLDSSEPKFYDLNLDKNDITLKKSIKKYLFTTYSQHSELIYNYYKHCKDNKPEDITDIEYIKDKLYDKKYENLPRYILNFFCDISKNLKRSKNDENELNKLKTMINDNELFIKKLNEYLEVDIDELLGIE